jgi:hypothetical protein
MHYQQREGVLTNYGKQELKEKQGTIRIEEAFSLKQDKFKVTVCLDKERLMTTTPFYNKYNIQQFDLHPTFSPTDFYDKNPKGTHPNTSTRTQQHRTHCNGTLLFLTVQFN